MPKSPLSKRAIKPSGTKKVGSAKAKSDPPMSLVERVSQAVERELTQIDTIVGNAGSTPAAKRANAESRARTLASLARTLKEVMQLRDQEREAESNFDEEASKLADDDFIPRDLDEFRRELSRRLEKMVAARAAIFDGRDE